jgi:hypothetical protein
MIDCTVPSSAVPPKRFSARLGREGVARTFYVRCELRGCCHLASLSHVNPLAVLCFADSRSVLFVSGLNERMFGI